MGFRQLRASRRRKERNFLPSLQHDFAAFDSLRSFRAKALKSCPGTCLRRPEAGRNDRESNPTPFAEVKMTCCKKDEPLGILCVPLPRF